MWVENIKIKINSKVIVELLKMCKLYFQIIITENMSPRFIMKIEMLFPVTKT